MTDQSIVDSHNVLIELTEQEPGAGPVRGRIADDPALLTDGSSSRA